MQQLRHMKNPMTEINIIHQKSLESIFVDIPFSIGIAPKTKVMAKNSNKIIIPKRILMLFFTKDTNSYFF